MKKVRRALFRGVVWLAAMAMGIGGVVIPGVALTLNGNYLQVTINNRGGLIESGSSIRFDPTGTGNYTAADVFWPGTSVENFRVGVDGVVYTNTDLSGTLLDVSAGTLLKALYTTTPFADLILEQTISFDVNAQSLRFDIAVTNTSLTTSRNVKYLRYGDPDQGFNVGGGFGTSNDVQAVSAGKLVTAFNSAAYAVGYGATGLSDAVAFEVSTYEVSAENFEDQTPDDILNSPEDPDGFSDDIAINIAFDLGTLAPEQTKTFSFYLLIAPTVSELLTLFDNLDTTPPGPAARIALTGSTRTLSPGASRTLTATVQDEIGHRIRTDNETVIIFSQVGGDGSVTGLGSVTVTEGRALLTVMGENKCPTDCRPARDLHRRRRLVVDAHTRRLRVRCGLSVQ